MGEVVAVELKGGETHSYFLALTPGQYVNVVVEQKGVDVVVVLRGPDGKQITQVDSPNGSQGPEKVSEIAEGAGKYRLEVRSPNKQAKAGLYEIKIKDLREATTTDRTRVTAERIFEEGNRLRDQQTAESRRKSIQKYKEALPLWQTLGARQEEATTLVEIGANHSSLGETKEALEYYHQALPLYRLVGNRAQEAGVLNNIGSVYNKVSEMQKALDYFGQSLLLKRAVGDRRGEANTLGNMGVAYSQMGELQDALEHHLQALSLWKAINDLRGEAVALGNIGVVYSKLGEQQKALEYYQQALPLRRALNDRIGEGTTLHNLAKEYILVGELPKALDYLNQSLPIRRDIGDRIGQAYTLKDIGQVYSRMGEWQKALEYHNLALTLARATEDRIAEAATLSSFGNTYVLLRETDKALDYYAQALQLNRTAGSQGGEAETLRKIALVERELGHLDKARDQIEAALKIIESTRSKFFSQQLRTSFSASRHDYYDLYIDLLMRMHGNNPSAGFDAAALQASEHARARSLLDILTESRANIRQGIDPELMERERSTQRQLSVKAEQLTRLLGGKHTEEQEKVARREVEALLGQYQEVEAEIRAKSPRYAALTQPQPLSLKEIQQVLDENTLLLEYALGEQRSYLWAVTPASVKSFELPRRAEIEAAARRVYEALTARNKEVSFEETGERVARIAMADAEYTRAARALSQMLLRHVADQMKGRRLLIVSDGILQYMPFAALPLPDSPGRSAKHLTYVPLIVKHEVVSIPSASTLAVLRKEMAARKPAPRTVAVLADPVFHSSDERVRVAKSSPGTHLPASGGDSRQAKSSGIESELTRSFKDVTPGVEEGSLFQLPRLPFTRQEAEAIVAFAPTHEYQKDLDFAANRAAALDPQLSQYRYVHFATHAILNNQHPELSGIVLSLVDQDGKDKDGFLLAHEVYSLKLPAELIVLSGCRTGLGKEVRGEGLLGLTRGFMYAGAARVLVSLWDVSDKSTAELMAHFYKGMLGKQRLSPAAALRQAQLAMWKSARWSSPYHWAAFVMHGEYR